MDLTNDTSSVISDITDMCDMRKNTEYSIEDIKCNLLVYLNSLNMEMLRNKCKDIGIPGAYKLKKTELVTALYTKFNASNTYLNSKSMNELKLIGKSRNIKRISALKKSALIYHILAYNANNLIFTIVDTPILSVSNPNDTVSNGIDIDNIPHVYNTTAYTILSDMTLSITPYVEEDDKETVIQHGRRKKRVIYDEDSDENNTVTMIMERDKLIKTMLSEDAERTAVLVKEAEQKALIERLRVEEDRRILIERLRAEEEDRMANLVKEAEQQALIERLRAEEEDRMAVLVKKDEHRKSEEAEHIRLSAEDKKDAKRKKQSIPKNVRIIIWNHYIGEDIIKHKCLCCKKVTITNTNFEVGHVQSEKHGGMHEINNLRPICGSCNHSMGTENMIDFVVKYGLYIG
jgi:5-methylcytosine-specific restriction endonuclease McrA